MRMTIYKFIMFIAAFIFAQGAIMPWVVSNDVLPLWLDILIISLLLMIWLFIAEKLGKILFKKIRDKDASSE